MPLDQAILCAQTLQHFRGSANREGFPGFAIPIIYIRVEAISYRFFRCIGFISCSALRTRSAPRCLQALVPELHQLVYVLGHDHGLGVAGLLALKSLAHILGKLLKPVPYLLIQGLVCFCQTLYESAVPQHHLAGVSHHLFNSVLITQAAVQAYLGLHQGVKVHSVQKVRHNEGLQVLILRRGILPDEVGQLVGGGEQHGVLAVGSVSPGIYIQIHHSVIVEAIDANILPGAVLGAFIHDDVYTGSLGIGLQNIALLL